MAKDSLQKYDCDRSGFTHKKSDLVRQRGLLLAPDEVDDLSRIKIPNPRWRSPRDNSTTTTAVTNPTVYTITEDDGIDALRQSQEFREDGVRAHYFMHIVGECAPTTISSNPRIVAGSDKDLLTLYGTDKDDFVIIQDGNGVSLMGGVTMELKDGDSISFVYTSADSLWRETSRFKAPPQQSVADEILIM